MKKMKKESNGDDRDTSYPDESRIEYGRRMTIRHGVIPWGLVYVGDAIRQLADAIGIATTGVEVVSNLEVTVEETDE